MLHYHGFTSIDEPCKASAVAALWSTSRSVWYISVVVVAGSVASFLIVYVQTKWAEMASLAAKFGTSL